MSVSPSFQPGLAPPPGRIPDFQEPFTLQPYQILTIAACIFVTTTIVAARVYTKLRIIRTWTWEDYTCIIGWVMFVVYMGLNFQLGRHGGGTHQWNLTMEQVEYVRRYVNIGDMIYSLSLLATKLSVLLLILRVFCSVVRDRFYWLTIGLMASNTIFYLLFFFIPIFLCSPRSKIWNKDEPGRCLNVNVLYLTSASFNAISDIAMLSVPVYLIWRLQMSVKRKAGVSAIFCTGALACISSLLRLTYIVFLVQTDDFTYTHFETHMWAFAEIAFGLLCGCAPVMPRLYRHFESLLPCDQEGTSHGPVGHSSTNIPRESTRRRDWMQLEEGKGGLPIPAEPLARDGKPRPGKKGNEGDAFDQAIEGQEGTFGF